MKLKRKTIMNATWIIMRNTTFRTYTIIYSLPLPSIIRETNEGLALTMANTFTTK